MKVNKDAACLDCFIHYGLSIMIVLEKFWNKRVVINIHICNEHRRENVQQSSINNTILVLFCARISMELSKDV